MATWERDGQCAPRPQKLVVFWRHKQGPVAGLDPGCHEAFGVACPVPSSLKDDQCNVLKLEWLLLMWLVQAARGTQ